MEPVDLHSSLIGSKINTSQPQFTICDHCKAVFSDSSSIRLLLSLEGLDHRRNRYSMIKTALDGCNLCREMLCMPWDIKFLEPNSKQMALVRQWNTPRNWPVNHWKSMIRKQESRSLIMASLTRCVEQNLRFNWQCDHSGFATLSQHRKLRKCRSLTVWMSLESDKPETANCLKNLLPKKDTTCDRTYEKIRNWLATCDTCHSRCRDAQSSMGDETLAPSMILDVSVNTELGNNNIKLRRVVGREISYAALSYCWGAKQPNATSRSNVSIYLAVGINADLLPQTIQDAIEVTRKLGLQYLWVDSMCIIQDSNDDKVHEIGRMSQIYNNAYVTISASRSAKCTAGFLTSRNPNVIEIPVCADDTTAPTAVEIISLSFQEFELKTHEPIYSRAWTFQESFMSRRMLIYSQRQVFWCCAHEWGKDGGSMSRKTYFREASPGVYGGVEVSRYSNEKATLDQWKKIIEMYSLRELGDPMDKLPALSCVASFFAKTMNARYLAGLWSNAIPTLLCWYPKPFTSKGTTRPTAWRSPSWSFLSMDGGVCFHRVENDTCSSAVVSCNAIPISTKAPFGQISSASLVIRGSLIRLNYPRKGVGLRFHDFHRWEFDTPVRRGKYDEIETNYGKISRSQSFWAFPLVDVSEKNRILDGLGGRMRNHSEISLESEKPWGIILARLRNGNYHRVGWFEAAHEIWDKIKRMQEKTVTIV